MIGVLWWFISSVSTLLFICVILFSSQPNASEKLQFLKSDQVGERVGSSFKFKNFLSGVIDGIFLFI